MQFTLSSSVEYNNVYTTDEDCKKPNFYKGKNDIGKPLKGKPVALCIEPEYLSEKELDP
jgi:hypothetical protein